ncbi:HAD family acid phosphatase [Dankookia rubra]|uniref:HAD family acid phosphatase n=1 Tax=Dankookia rubra TaxID=1442381 RepID=UPI0019D599B2|nr:HAD family acid phosphatase [Dankookia rubra]
MPCLPHSPSPNQTLLAVTLLAMLAACSAPSPLTDPAAVGPAPVAIAAISQPANVGDAKRAARAYHDSGAYARDLAVVVTEARSWLNERTPQVSRPALVLDIDETALSNWEVIQRDDFGRIIGGPCRALPEGPCGWAAWDLLGRDPALQPTLRLFQQARASGVSVFFITGRPESQRSATERNLRNVGYDGYEHLFMVPDGRSYDSAVKFKTPVRAGIERLGHKIIANVGDQPSDLEGGYAERSFLLPNPFYRVP